MVAVVISTEGRSPPQETLCCCLLGILCISSRFRGWLHRDRYQEANVAIALQSNLTLVIAQRLLRVGNTALLWLNIHVSDTPE